MHKRIAHASWLAVLCFGLASVSIATAASTTPPQGIRSKPASLKLFTNARIIVSPEQTIASGQLLIDSGRVVAVGESVSASPGAMRIDLGGKTIAPGLIDPYTEYGLAHVGRLYERRTQRTPKLDGTREGANAWNDAIHAQVEWVDRFRVSRKDAETWYKRGVTTVYSIKHDGIFRGRGFVANLGDALPNDEVVAAHALAGLSFDKGTSQQTYPRSLMGSIALLRQTFYDADWYRAASAAFEANPNQQMPEFNQPIATLGSYSGPFLIEVDDELTLLRAARIAEEFDLDFIYVGSNMEYARLDEIVALDAPIILPLAMPKKPEIASLEDERDVRLADLRHFERAPHNARVLHEAGVTIALTGHGLTKKEDFRKNLRRLIAAGLPEQTALAAVTTVPAELLGVSDHIGTLEPGKMANFAIYSDDLFAAKSDLYSVWIDGDIAHELLSLEAIDWRGDWQLTIDDQSYDLSIKGSRKKLTGTLGRDTTTVKLSNLSGELRHLHFSAPLDSFGTPAIVRVALTSIGNRLIGSADLPLGRVPATATRTGDWEPVADKTEAIVAQPLLSTLTFPNVAFGFETMPEPEDILIRNATIWTSDDDRGVLRNADMLVRDGVIRDIGENLDAPSDVRVIDGTNKHISPGIIDEHSHICISRGVNEGSHSNTAEVRIGDVVNSDDIAMYRALAGGATAAQLLHGSANSVGGQAQVIKFRWGKPPEELKIETAPPTIKFALGENVKQSNWGDNNRIRYPQTRMGVESIMKDGFLAAVEYEAAWDAYDELSRSDQARTVPPRRNLQLDAMLAIRNSEMFIHCHSYHQTEILMLMRLAEEFGFTLQTFTHILEGYKVAPEMAAHGAGGSSFADWWAYKYEVIDAIPHNPCLMHQAGVVTSINSDSQEMIRRLNQEAAKSVMYCGMAEEDALDMVTINPAIQLKIDDLTGSLVPGKDADFVIWNGPPLATYSTVEQTWVDGTNYFSRERDAALRVAVTIEKRALIQKLLGADSTGSAPSHSEQKMEKEWHCDDVQDVWHVRGR